MSENLSFLRTANPPLRNDPVGVLPAQLLDALPIEIVLNLSTKILSSTIQGRMRKAKSFVYKFVYIFLVAKKY